MYMENWRKEELFDIGTWVSTEDGIGQVLYNRSIYFEEFDQATSNYKFKKGTFHRTIYICKILSDFKGIVKKRFKIELYTSISKLKSPEKKLIKNIKSNSQEEYKKYLLYEPKEDLTRQVFLEYNIKKDELGLVNTEIDRINKLLQRTFSFKEFKKEGDNSNLPFKISEFIKNNEKIDRSKCVTIRLDSDLYKVKGKEALFSHIRVIKL